MWKVSSPQTCRSEPRFKKAASIWWARMCIVIMAKPGRMVERETTTTSAGDRLDGDVGLGSV